MDFDFICKAWPLPDLHACCQMCSFILCAGLCGRQEAMCGDVRELGRTFAMLSRFEEAVQSKVRGADEGI